MAELQSITTAASVRDLCRRWRYIERKSDADVSAVGDDPDSDEKLLGFVRKPMMSRRRSKRSSQRLPSQGALKMPPPSCGSSSKCSAMAKRHTCTRRSMAAITSSFERR